MLKYSRSVWLIISMVFFGCQGGDLKFGKKSLADAQIARPDTIYIVSLGGFSSEHQFKVDSTLNEFYKTPVKLLNGIPLYKNAYNQAGKYTARTILDNLQNDYQNLHGKIIALTDRDISTNMPKKNAPYWGVMGLGLLGKKSDQLTSCVVSTFRMKSNFEDRLLKVAIHEIGHTYGLNHCLESTECIMNDATGSGKKIDGLKKMFCPSCMKKYKTNKSKQG